MTKEEEMIALWFMAIAFASMAPADGLRSNSMEFQFYDTWARDLLRKVRYFGWSVD